MQANEVLTTENPEVRQRAPQIASWRHLVGFLLIGAGMVALGFLAQHVPAGGGATSGGHSLPCLLSSLPSLPFLAADNFVESRMYRVAATYRNWDR